jgi:hypothetical protein
LTINLKFFFILCAALLAVPATSLALDLGEAVVKSSLGQPLRAEIEITGATRAQIDALSVRLASPETSASRGLSRPPQIDELRFRIGKSASGSKPVIHVTTSSAVSEPDMVFLVEASWPGAELLQEFSLVLEPAKKAGGLTVTRNRGRHHAPEQSTSEASVAIEYELDAYYTNIGAFIPLTEAPMKQIEVGDETVIYGELLANAFTPRFFLVEASVYPLPVLGVYLKEEQESFFDRTQVNDDFNLIEALTEGFEEPYALSFFVGNVIRFTSPRSRIFRAVNKGYSGFLVSVGDQHIKDSELIDDDWYEIEWKLKGDRRIEDIYHSWSFRIGSKIHDNPDIADVNYVGLRRELFNGKPGDYSWYENVGIDYSVYFSRDDGDIVQHQIFFEKRWPSESTEYSLGIGVNKIIDKYSGELENDEDETRLILRPGFSF